MIGPASLLVCLILLTIVLAAIFLIRPAITAGVTGKILAFVALFMLPALCIGAGMSAHMQRSEETRFCTSCHAMQPFGQSLYIDNTSYIPAAHFQNHRVPANQACYTCHADYSIYGPFKDKLRGLTRIYMQYVSTPPVPIHLIGSWDNRQCLHCHGGARDFNSNPIHMALMDSLKSNQMTCISSGCHDMIHDVAGLNHMKFWSPGQ